jgi:hypothetical protein
MRDCVSHVDYGYYAADATYRRRFIHPPQFRLRKIDLVALAAGIRRYIDDDFSLLAATVSPMPLLPPLSTPPQPVCDSDA